MNINTNNYQTSFGKAATVKKIFRCHLKDGSTVLVRITSLPQDTLTIIALDAEKIKKGRVTGGYGTSNKMGLSEKDIAVFLEKIQGECADKMAAFKGFLKAVTSK